MTSYDSMRSKLLPTGLYRLDGSTAVDSELRAYAVELDRLYAAVDELLREALIPTAETYGITERERFFGKVHTELTVPQRRALLMAREAGAADCGLADLNALIEACGVSDYTVTVTQRQNKIRITVNTPLGTSQRADFEQRVRAFTPVTFETIISYGS